MFAGHYAAAMAAKAARPEIPLWSLFIGAQLVDVGWSALVAGGVERFRVDGSLPGSPLDLYHMPWTHSLPAAVLWAIAGALAFAMVLRLSRTAAAIFALTILSHWVLDLFVHRPDLALWIGGPKVGLGLWNAPVVEQAVEIGLLGVGAVLWCAQRVRAGQAAWPVAMLISAIVSVQIAAMTSPIGGSPVQMGLSAFLPYLSLAGVAALTELRSRQRDRETGRLA